MRMSGSAVIRIIDGDELNLGYSFNGGVIMRLFAIVILGIVLSACGAPKENSGADVRAEIEQANTQWMGAFKDGDIEKLAKMYTEDTRLLPPNAGVLEGRAAVRQVFGGMMDAGIRVELSTQNVESLGDTAVEIGRAKVIGPDGGLLDDGKYLVTWKKTSTGWKMHRDIWNSSLPGKDAASG
ncbi:hypothetical protein AVO43_12435 [Microbulbifer sp. ZGT114]|nr:hypothetical protein AVO43_12435 [Microbulbifer sp. ZGT114]